MSVLDKLKQMLKGHEEQTRSAADRGADELKSRYGHPDQPAQQQEQQTMDEGGDQYPPQS